MGIVSYFAFGIIAVNLGLLTYLKVQNKRLNRKIEMTKRQLADTELALTHLKATRAVIDERQSGQKQRVEEKVNDQVNSEFDSLFDD